MKRATTKKIKTMALLVRLKEHIRCALKGLQTAMHRSTVKSTVNQMLAILKKYVKGKRTRKVFVKMGIRNFTFFEGPRMMERIRMRVSMAAMTFKSIVVALACL